MPANNNKREKKYHLWGWGLFLVCAVFFIAASVESGSAASLIGSIIFFAACIVFLIPLLSRSRKD